jgi:hypothetical protein
MYVRRLPRGAVAQCKKLPVIVVKKDEKETRPFL